MKAFGYIKAPVDGPEFTRQENIIRVFSVSNGIEIVSIFHDAGELGTSEENECSGFQAMVLAIHADGVRTIVVEGQERLARNRQILASLLVYLGSKGITLIAAGTGRNVTEAVMADPAGKTLILIQGVFAGLEKDMLVAKLRRARVRTREKKGKCEGRKSLSETSPQTVDAIRQLRRKVPGCKRMTDAQVADELNDNGMVTASGKKWNRFHVQNVRKALQIS
ncbi:MAG: recombinase family protein [Desulfovibrionaceae bacterium]|nr:recombinase family protein [Desulfovibrionaceae bacterium]MBF0512436.1 recombinase family protein [Desulfovibrionaceae bacterium]